METEKRKTPKTEKQVKRRLFELQCEICKAVAHPMRLEIVDLLSRREMSATSLIAALETSKANVSKHVNQLVQAGVVGQNRRGRQVSYRLSYPEIHEACTLMRAILLRRLKSSAALAQAAPPGRKK